MYIVYGWQTAMHHAVWHTRRQRRLLAKKKGKRTNVRRDFTREMFLYILYMYMSGVWSIFREPSECFAGAVAAESKK